MEKIPNGKYSKEFREEAVKLVTVKGHSIDDAAKRLSLPKTTLANWIRSFKAGNLGDIGKGYKILSETELEITRLRRELAEVKMERDIIKKAALSSTCQGFPARYAMINELRQHYPTPAICRQLHVSTSGYYRWQIAPLSARQKAEDRLELEILAAHNRTRGTYGAERLQEDLAAHGIKVGIHRIKRIRQKLGIRCRQKKKFKATTNSKHNLPVAHQYS